MAYDYEELVAWNRRVGAYPMFDPTKGPCDFHRLQLERWLWDARVHMMQPIVDIGAEIKHSYMGKQYLALNDHCYMITWGEVKPDILGNLLYLPFATGSIGTIVCLEVLEHVPNLFRGVSEIKRVLKPGGTAYVSSPFIWPTHDTEEYGDFWRITGQGYHFLFHDCDAVRVTPTEMRRSAQYLWASLASWECMGSGFECRGPTGYMVEARK